MAKRKKRRYYYDSPYHKATKAKDDYKGGFTVFVLKYVFRLFALSWRKLGPGPTIGIVGVPILFIVVANVLSNSTSNAVKKVPVPATSYRDMVESQQKKIKPQNSVSPGEVVIRELPTKEEKASKPKVQESSEIQSAIRTSADPMQAIPKEGPSVSRSMENVDDSGDLMDEFR